MSAGLSRWQRGQAAIEMSIASAFLLVPLFLMTPMIGKYADMAMATHQAAHYAAFQRTVVAEPTNLIGLGDHSRGAEMVELSNGSLKNSAIARYFGGNTFTINNLQQSAAFNLVLYENRPLWTDHAGNELLPTSSLLPSIGSAGLSMSEAFTSPDLGGTALQATMGTVNTLTLNTVGFRFNYSWYYTATMTMSPENPIGPEPFDSLGLTFTASATVLGDGWSASAPGYTTQQISGVVPTSKFGPINAALLATAVVLPDVVQLELGRIVEDDPCEVPSDRTLPGPTLCTPLLPEVVPLP